MSNYTKGPWAVGREWIDDGDGSEVEVFSVMAGDEPVTDQPIYEVDARLMAAAPDLLEAAQAVCEAWGKFIDSFDYVPGIGDQAEDIEFQEMMRLRIAINKATINQ